LEDVGKTMILSSDLVFQGCLPLSYRRTVPYLYPVIGQSM
jgi:hypothetical protein